MNQKNIFTVFGVVLLLQGVVFFLMADKMISGVFPDLDVMGKFAATNLMQVIAGMIITLGLVSFAVRNTPQVLWAYTIGAFIGLLIALKHEFADHINVPVSALVIQFGITLLSGYLWMQKNKVTSS